MKRKYSQSLNHLPWIIYHKHQWKHISGWKSKGMPEKSIREIRGNKVDLVTISYSHIFGFNFFWCEAPSIVVKYLAPCGRCYIRVWHCRVVQYGFFLKKKKKKKNHKYWPQVKYMYDSIHKPSVYVHNAHGNKRLSIHQSRTKASPHLHGSKTPPVITITL